MNYRLLSADRYFCICSAPGSVEKVTQDASPKPHKDPQQLRKATHVPKYHRHLEADVFEKMQLQFKVGPV